MACDNNNNLIERLLECENELKNLEDDLLTWTDSLEELSEIEDTFATDGKINLDKKTILDVGTDCVKPLYIALKFKPDKIIGIVKIFLFILSYQALNRNLNFLQR